MIRRVARSSLRPRPGRVRSRLHGARLGVILAISILAGLFPAASLLCAQPPGPERDRIVVGIDEDNPPYSFVDRRGRPHGLAVDLARTAAEILELRIEWRTGTSPELYEALAAGEIDLVPHAPDTPSFAERFEFTLPHSAIEDAAFVLDLAGPGPDETIEEWLAGRAVIALPWSPAAAWLADEVPDARLVEAGSVADGLRQLAAGEADVALLPRRTGVSVKKRLRLDRVDVLPARIDRFPNRLGFALRSGDAELRDDLDTALVLMTDDGRYLDIYDRWQSDDPGREDLARFAAWVLAPVLALLALSMLWTFFLRRTVTRRTRELEREMAERRNLEDQVRQAQKLESLGVLAGGIAHDFNNLLTVIQGNANLAKLQTNEGSSVRTRLDRIEEAGRRAADLTRQMLAYSGRGQFVTETVDLSALVLDTRSLRESLVSKKARIVEELAENLPPIVADPAQLRQLLVQILVNASEALGDGPGTIVLRTGVRSCTRDELERTYLGEPMAAGDYVYLEIEDDGEGMNEATIERIFEPFFSTKFTGRGLGLAAALGIVRGHAGALSVESSPGKGSCFRVFFPVAAKTDAANDPSGPVAADDEPPASAALSEPPVAAANPPAAESGSAGPVPEGTTVLVADDEAHLRMLVREILEEEGLQVLDARDGEEAVAIFREHPEIRIVVLDATMPRLDGAEAYERLRRMRPEVRVVLASGYDERQAMGRLQGPQLVTFLAKPFEPEALIEAVRLAAEVSPRPARRGGSASIDGR